MKGWFNGWKDVEQRDGWKDGWMKGREVGWKNGRVDGRTDIRTVERAVDILLLERNLCVAVDNTVHLSDLYRPFL